MKTAHRHVYLASRSLRRRELLKQIGVGFEVLLLREAPGRSADLDESAQAGEDPLAYVQRVARAKAELAWMRLMQRRLRRHPVVTADTTFPSRLKRCWMASSPNKLRRMPTPSTEKRNGVRLDRSLNKPILSWRAPSTVDVLFCRGGCRCAKPYNPLLHGEDCATIP